MLLFLPEQESQSTKLSGATRQLNVIDRWGANVKLVIGCYPRTKRWRVAETEEASRANRWNAVAFGFTHAWRSVLESVMWKVGGYEASVSTVNGIRVSHRHAKVNALQHSDSSWDTLLLTIEKMQAEIENLTGDGGRRCCAEFLVCTIDHTQRNERKQTLGYPYPCNLPKTETPSQYTPATSRPRQSQKLQPRNHPY
jgi:hypothetical protein